MDDNPEILKTHLIDLVNALRPLVGCKSGITEADQKRAARLVRVWDSAFAKWREKACAE